MRDAKMVLFVLLAGWVTNMVFANPAGQTSSRAVQRDSWGRITRTVDSSGLSL